MELYYYGDSVELEELVSRQSPVVIPQNHNRACAMTGSIKDRLRAD